MGNLELLLCGLLLLCGVVLLVVFSAPLFLRIHNAGTLLGMAAGLLLLAAALLHKPLLRLLAFCWDTTAGRLLLLLLAGCLLLGIGISGYCSVRMAAAQHRRPRQPATVVVLGCKVRGTVPSLMLQRRLDAAHAYLTAHPELSCIVSGGQGPGEDIPEAEAMQHYLTQKGIAPERIYQEAASFNTRQNLAFSKRILEAHALPDTIVIVTDGFHQYRAQILARRVGLTAYAWNCHTRTLLLPTYWVREWLALVKTLLRT